MAFNLDLKFVAQPTDGDGLFDLRVIVLNKGYYDIHDFIFKNTPLVNTTDITYIQIGIDFLETCDNLFTELQLRYTGYSYISVSKNIDEITISLNPTPDYTGNAIASVIDYNIYTVFLELSETPIPVTPSVINVLSRSPYFVTELPEIEYDEIRADLYIYRGDRISDRPMSPTYSVSKKTIIALQPAISFDIHKIVNDYVKNNYNSTLGTVANTTSTLDTVWCFFDAGIYANDVLAYNVQQQLLILDGFGYTTELANPSLNKKVLSSINSHVIYTGGDYPLYFITKDLTSIVINGTNVPFTFNQDFNSQNIGYVNVSNYIGVSTSFNAVFTYTTETVIHSFTIKDECRFTTINCIFKNKYGFWQTIPFNKLSKKSIDFESQDYSGLIANFGSYDMSQHEKKTFLLNGKEKITVNTDFINESYNTLFVELMLSEFVYLEESGNVLPVNLLKKSFEKKTKLNNKLIQYSMDFEYSFKLMNTIL